MLDKLQWFLREKSYASCGKQELQAFLAYVASGNVPDGGRWGNPQQIRAVRPFTTKTYHGHLRTFFRWLIDDGHLTASPMEAITSPAARADQIQPFTEKQAEALLSAAKRTLHPKRDEAILSFLLDTGVRASELCGLRLCDLDAAGRTCIVQGYGRRLGLTLAPHKLRHSAITAALEAGADGREVQGLSRHAKLETLMRYDDSRTDKQGKASQLLSGLI